MASKAFKTSQKKKSLDLCNGWGEVWQLDLWSNLTPLAVAHSGFSPALRGYSLVSMCPRLKQGLKLEIRALRGGGGGLDLYRLQRTIKQQDIK